MKIELKLNANTQGFTRKCNFSLSEKIFPGDLRKILQFSLTFFFFLHKNTLMKNLQHHSS